MTRELWGRLEIRDATPRPNDQRDRYLSEDELRRLKLALDDKTYCKEIWGLMEAKNAGQANAV